MNSDIYYHDTVVVFDLDDTLINERDFCRSGFRLITDYLCNHYDEARFHLLAGKMEAALNARQPYIPILDRALSPDLLYLREELLDLYGGKERPMSIDPNVLNTLDTLRHRGIKMGIITDGRGKTQRTKIRSAGLTPYFSPDMIFISEEQGHDKSSPHSFVQIVRKYPEAKRFIYIGDNPAKDITVPALLGWETAILAYNQDNVHSEYNYDDISAEPTYKSIKFNEIPDILP